MADLKKRFVPVTPAGSIILALEADTEQEAWDNLLRAASHMPYKTKENFIKRGYTICELINPSESEAL